MPRGMRRAPLAGLFFDSWAHVGEVAARGAITYLAVVVALRFIGMQALAQMSAYDLICTIALGSFVANGTDLSAFEGLDCAQD